MNKVILPLVFMLSILSTKAQNLDSLLVVAQGTENDSVKARLLNRVGFAYIFKDIDKSADIIRDAKQWSEEKGLNYSIVELTNTYGVYMDVKGISDSAGFYFNKSLHLSKEYNLPDQLSRSTNNLGMYNWNRGNLDEALKYFFSSLKMDEERGDKKATSKPLNNIGLIYQEMSIPEKALEYHEKALAIRTEFDMKKDMVASYNNIGICYKNLGRIEDAISSYKKGLVLAEASSNYMDYYRILDNLGTAYQIQEKYDEAIGIYQKSLLKPANYDTDPKGDLITYSNLVSAYNFKNEPRKALSYGKKGLDLLRENPFHEFYATDLYLHLAETNYMLNRITEARDLKEKYVAIKDSMFSENNAKAIADLEVKYETEKKEKEILVQRAELAEQDLIIQKRNFQVYGLGAIALLVGLLGYLFYNQQKLKNIQLQKENELKDALIKIETQNRLQEQRLRISRDLHDNIGAQLTFIISSIDSLKYGFKIKDDQLTKKLNGISEFTRSTIFELRDTIWAMNKSEISIEDLKTRITNFLDNADKATEKVDFSFNMDLEELESLRFSSVQGINVYRVIQESVNNALKYANANKIDINIAKEDKLKVTIKDDGDGFDILKTELGNGINNMKKRAHELGGEITINSSLGEGTSVILILSENG